MYIYIYIDVYIYIYIYIYDLYIYILYFRVKLCMKSLQTSCLPCQAINAAYNNLKTTNDDRLGALNRWCVKGMAVS